SHKLFFASRRRHTRSKRDWSSDVCSSDLDHIGVIGNGIRALIQHPAELAKLRARPELIGVAVEECLRYDGPIVFTVRILHGDARSEERRVGKSVDRGGGWMLRKKNRNKRH